MTTLLKNPAYTLLLLMARIVVCMVGIGILTGCATNPTFVAARGFETTQVKRLALVVRSAEGSFTSLETNQSPRYVVDSSFTQVLIGKGYRLVPREQFDEVMREVLRTRPDFSVNQSTRQAAAILKATHLLVVTISQASAVKTYSDREKASLRISCNLIEMPAIPEGNEVVVSASQAEIVLAGSHVDDRKLASKADYLEFVGNVALEIAYEFPTFGAVVPVRASAP